MSIETRLANTADRDRWNDLAARSPHGTFFHEYETLQIQVEHADATLHPLIGYKGREPIGFFPVFESQGEDGTRVFSPPPELSIAHVGPALLNMAKLKQRKREIRRERFLENCFEWIESELSPHYCKVRTATAFTDARPFRWKGYSIDPGYTYRVDIGKTENALLEHFSSDARRNVRNADPDGYEIEEGGLEELESILEQVRHRFEHQDMDFEPPNAFIKDLHSNTPNGSVRPYVLRVDDEYVGGVLTFEYGDTISRWMGGVRPDGNVDVPVNDLLDWRIMTDGIDRGMRQYDLVGAETQRLNRYKAKFNPSLVTYYNMERKTTEPSQK